MPAVGDYVPMDELIPGTALLSADGQIVTVVDSTIRHGSFDVYNFEVEGQHNYYVSDDEVLVHNEEQMEYAKDMHYLLTGVWPR